MTENGMSEASQNAATCRFTCQNGEIIEVDRSIALKFGTIKQMLEDLHDDNEETIPLPCVNSTELRQAIQWCEMHKNDAPEVDYESSGTDSDDDDADLDEQEQYRRERRCDVYLDERERNFFENLDPNDINAIFPLMKAANFLNIEKLLDNGCKYVAGIMRGRTPQWIRKRFGLKCDFTEEQKAKIREELSWYDDNIKISDDEEPPLQQPVPGPVDGN